MAWKIHLRAARRFLTLLILWSAWGYAQTAPVWNAMDWIDGDFQTSTPTWEKQLGINATRVSCRVTIHDTPQKCADFVRSLDVPGITKYFLYIQTNLATLPADMSEYSTLSVGVPSIESIGIDDFFGSYQTWYTQLPDAATFVSQVIDNLKSANSSLKFGITLYENELDPVRNPYIDDAHLPASVKAKFDYIHLFLHYRKNGPAYADYVAQAQRWFPRAKIIAGVYPYDRIDYFPCAQNDAAKKPCTQTEELSYFQKALDIQAQLLKEGKVTWLELFPGYFGAENQLYGPNSDHLTCSNVARCVQNTKTMRDSILAAHGQFLLAAQPSVSATVPFIPPRVFPNPWRADRHDHQPVTFDQLIPGSTIKVFTTSGHLVKTLSPSNALITWDMANEKGVPVASGLYFYLVSVDNGQTARGQLAIIR